MSRWDWFFHYVLWPLLAILWAMGIAFNEQAIRNWEEVGRTVDGWGKESKERHEAPHRKLDLDRAGRPCRCGGPKGEDDE